ncbi:polyprenol phosphomannose-dependent alpha 1,6 mannosyltransferase MptB [Micromonospora sp. WMMD812]|uniref:polyprenol phosphomannose-dependent alpha 1,6 mannosyltransferase MptB n=1 Tax=Micromonospora sp. WMMD812 TaxID=3015152 RepID=UPI00248C9929|nr:polyprenol phosphomannose-dependent alpha 1,6 mannosyltransferase MptB [Micromonospora sp. WMMD812]WBB68151.1 polyprenol phosphomannose-dependent alpha 1,6 mannosyltransferase MptB [Micromonospora sp. WMMD812]
MRTLPTVHGYRMLGGVGATLIAVAGLAAGALPVETGPAWWTDLRHLAEPALLCGYAGLTLLVAAWWWAGRDLRATSRRAAGSESAGESGARLDCRSAALTLACWAGPLLLSPPLFSRDAYSYLAQGAMVLADIDVYRHGVAALGGRLAAEVPQMWQQTPAPYGPVFLAIAAVVSGLTGGKLVLGLLGLRLVALAGVALLLRYLPRLARHCGVDPGAALWLGVLNPLVPLHLVAGAHNEAVMLGLLVAGLCLAFERRFGTAAVLITLAALVKAPAVVGLLVVVSLAARYSGRRVALARTAGFAAGTAAAVTWATGIGFGWISALGTPVYRHSWSVSSALGRGATRLAGALGLELGDGPMRLCLGLGLLAALAAAAAAWWQRRRLGPAYALGLALAAVALLGPATRPWYALWGLVLIAAAAPDGRARPAAALGAVVLAFVALPSGFGPDRVQAVLAAAGVLVGLLAVGWLRLLTAPLRLSTAVAR